LTVWKIGATIETVRKQVEEEQEVEQVEGLLYVWLTDW
jgi:hypothetical protein